jgi:hypothetical protein
MSAAPFGNPEFEHSQETEMLPSDQECLAPIPMAPVIRQTRQTMQFAMGRLDQDSRVVTAKKESL